MKKHDTIRAAAARKADRARKGKLGVRVALMVGFFIALTGVGLSVDAGVPLVDAILGIGSGTSIMASMALIGNIEDVGDKQVAGKQLGYRVYLAHISQIADRGFPKPNQQRELGQIPFLDGEVVHYFEAHVEIETESTGEKGDLTIANTNKLTFIMGGNSERLLNFIEEYSGQRFVLFYGETEDDILYCLGTRTRPMTFMSYTRSDNKEKRAIEFSFENSSYRQPVKYVGTLPTADPITIAGASDTLSLDSVNNTYLIASGTSSASPITKVSGITSNDKGRIVTLKGEGTANLRTIEDGAVFILEGGATWTAKKGSSICFRVVDTSRLVEVTGTRVQS